MASVLHSKGTLSRLELISYDARMSLARADTALPPEIAVVVIDEAALQALDPIVGRYPWPRSVYADLIEFLMLGEPRAIVFDILFSERQRLLGAPTDISSAQDAALAAATAASGITLHAMQLSKDDPDEARAARGVGVVGLRADSDGVYRRLRPLHPYDGFLYPALGLTPLTASDIASIPLDGRGQALIKLSGKVPAYSMSGLDSPASRCRCRPG